MKRYRIIGSFIDSIVTSGCNIDICEEIKTPSGMSFKINTYELHLQNDGTFAYQKIGSRA